MIFIKNVFFKIWNSKILLKKFQSFEYEVHQTGPNHNCMQNFSFLAYKGEAVGVAQISVNGDGGTWRTDFFFLLQTCI
jgi:hypothetical protein